jgi:hypothetical protein
MQAMIVTPAPGPKPFTPKSNIENQSGAESTFAPTLDQAINNKKSSADPTKETARSTQAAKVNKSSKDESNSEAESETAATQAPVTHQAASTNDQSATVHANASKTASTDQEKTSTLNSTGSRLADSQIDSEISALEQQSSSKTKANENEKLLSKNVQGQRTSDAFTQHSSKSNKESVVSAHFNQTLDSSSAISKDRMTSEHKQQPGNVVYVQNNDSIS